ncbi:tctex1 domain-containing 2 [Pyrrhoderma noxium]|uniref:Tctex1 domain-containing 2 n=1 Tax=Pyrrhoderma noxium TaxID=2282107 RepID=A0A286UM84_9AGAM|nr:tctex1 domain-containing 2 [Pyrrhoderma noxium]
MLVGDYDPTLSDARCFPRIVEIYHSLSPTSAASTDSRVKFDTERLKAYIKKLLASTLENEAFPQPKDRDRTKAWCKEIGERVKEQMLEIQPSGMKYVVLTRIDQNAGQGVHANIICHWEDGDTVAQESFSNETLICVCVALAIRTI